MTVATKWTLTADSENYSYDEITAWLGSEAIDNATVLDKDEDGLLEVQFSDLDSAFRFRMQFDEMLLDN